MASKTAKHARAASFAGRGFARLLRAGVTSLALLSLACSVLLCLGLWAGPERLWLFSLAQFAPYPVFLLPSLAVLVVACFAGRLAFLSASAATLLVVTYVMGLSVHVTAADRHDLRVMTFNIKDYITLQQRSGAGTLAREIARHDPDVLLLQDARADNAPDEDTKWKQIFDGREAYTFGQYVIASRLPMRDCHVGWISFRDERHSYATCTIRVAETDVDFVSVHFTTPRGGLTATRSNPIAGFREWRENIDDRMTQARTLAADIAHSAHPVIIGGDLNAPARSMVIRTLEDAGLTDAFSSAGLGYGYTWGHSLRTRFPFLRIDHIMSSRELEAVDCRVGLASGSAHHPVIADFVFRTPAR